MKEANSKSEKILHHMLLVIKGILVTASICILYDLRTSNVVCTAVFALYVMLYIKGKAQLERKEKIVKVLLSGIFAFFMALGELLVLIDSEFFSNWIMNLVLCLVGMYFLFELIIGILLTALRTNYFLEQNCARPSGKQKRKIFSISMLLLVIVWGIGWIRVYPGSMSRDSIMIADMALGNIDLLASVPIVYVMPIRFLWNIGVSIFGTSNAGLALCTFVQLFMVAIIVAYTITRLYANNVKKWLCIAFLLLYAFIPYNTYMVATIWKDIPFAASMLLFMVLICEAYLGEKTANKKIEYIRLLFLVMSGIGVCLMRNNGLFAYILFIPFALIMFYKKDKKIMGAILLTFVLARVIQGPVYDRIMTMQADKVAQKVSVEKETELPVTESKSESSDEKESSSQSMKKEEKVENATDSYNSSAIYIITAQQLANVAVDRPDLSEEDYERLNKAINVEKVRKNYAEKSDYCRRCIDITLPLVRYKLPTSEYLKTWVYFGMKYPINYILGWRGQTLGYWYPDIQNWTTIDAIIDNEIGIYKEPILSQETTNTLVKMEELYQKMPVYGMLWSIGFMVWINFFFAGVTYIRKGLKATFLYILLIGVWGTLLVATPIYAEFRYAYSFFLCMPLSILIPFWGSGKAEES